MSDATDIGRLEAFSDGVFLAADVTERDVCAKQRQTLLGLPTFTPATLVALVSPAAGLAMFGLVSLVYLLPADVVERRL